MLELNPYGMHGKDRDEENCSHPQTEQVLCVDPSQIRRAEVVHFIANRTTTTASVVGPVAIVPTGESL